MSKTKDCKKNVKQDDLKRKIIDFLQKFQRKERRLKKIRDKD